MYTYVHIWGLRKSCITTGPSFSRLTLAPHQPLIVEMKSSRFSLLTFENITLCIKDKFNLAWWYNFRLKPILLMSLTKKMLLTSKLVQSYQKIITVFTYVEYIIPDTLSTECVRDLDKLNLVKLNYGGLN